MTYRGSSHFQDFTPEEAARWVEQEFSKARTRAAIQERIKVERNVLAWAEKLAPSYPNSKAAHEALLARLEQALESMR